MLIYANVCGKAAKITKETFILPKKGRAKKYNFLVPIFFLSFLFLFIVQTSMFSISVIITILQVLTIYTSYIYSIYTQRKELQRKGDIYISLQRKCIRKDLLTNIFTKVKVMLTPENIYVFLCTIKYYSYLCYLKSIQTKRMLKTDSSFLIAMQTFPFQ